MGSCRPTGPRAATAKLLRAEVLALARQGDLPHRDLTGLSVASFGDQPLDLQSISAALLAAVLRGDGTEVSATHRPRLSFGLLRSRPCLIR